MFLNACKSKRLSTDKILVLDKTLNIQLNFSFYKYNGWVYNLDKLVLHMMKSYNFAHFLPCDALLLYNFKWDSA